jgi:trk system potassium uptake protein TrkA
MRIIIIGCGRVGSGLAIQLAQDGHEVILLDESTEAFRRLPPEFPGQALRGDGTDESVLRRAGADDADWFLALTNCDNRNILAAQLAAQTFGIANVICKINDPVRAQAYATLGVNTVDRTMMMIDSIGRFMGRPPMPGATDVTRAASRPPIEPVPPPAHGELPDAGGPGGSSPPTSTAGWTGGR